MQPRLTRKLHGRLGRIIYAVVTPVGIHQQPVPLVVDHDIRSVVAYVEVRILELSEDDLAKIDPRLTQTMTRLLKGALLPAIYVYAHVIDEIFDDLDAGHAAIVLIRSDRGRHPCHEHVRSFFEFTRITVLLIHKASFRTLPRFGALRNRPLRSIPGSAPTDKPFCLPTDR